MPFEELIAIVRDVAEHKSHRGRVSTLSHLHIEWRGELQIGELIAISEVSSLGGHGDQASLIWVMKVVGDLSFTVAKRFWSDKISENFTSYQSLL